MPEFVAVISARAGSTRLKRKNLRTLGGKPLVRIAVECARAVEAIREIVVSSDGEKILSVAAAASQGDERVTLHLRSPELSTAEAGIEPLLALLLAERPWATHAIYLPPTSPFREPHTVERCIGAIDRLGHDSCCTATMSGLGNYLWTKTGKQWRHPFAEGAWPRSQDVERRPLLHGACVIASRRLIDSGRLCDEGTYCVLTEAEEAVDIDTEEDLAMARGLWDAFVSGRGV